MRLRPLCPAIVAMTLAGCSSDLFHSTTWSTVCEIDPSTPGCGSEAFDASHDTEQEVGEDQDVHADASGPGDAGADRDVGTAADHESGSDASDSAADAPDS